MADSKRVGWSLTALSAQKAYIVPSRNYRLLQSFILFNSFAADFLAPSAG